MAGLWSIVRRWGRGASRAIACERKAATGVVLLTILTPALWAQTPGDLVRGITHHEFGEDAGALRVIESRVRDAASAEDRAAWSAALVELLSNTHASTDARRFACRQLVIVGDDASVTPLGNALRDDRLADVALWALESIEGEASLTALRDSLGHARGDTLVGVVRALGRRQDSASFVPIARLGNGADPTLRGAILESLGRIADENVARVLGGLFQSRANLAEDDFARAAVDAALLCAERRMELGDRTTAESLFDLVAREAPSEHAREAGMRGVVRAQGALGARTLVQMMDEGAGALARRLIVETEGDTLTRALASELASAPVEVRATLIEALAERGDAEATPAIAAFLNSGDDAVRVAAIRALGILAGERSGAALVSHLLVGRGGSSPPQGEERAIALEALSRTPDARAEAAIAGSLQHAGDAEASDLVGVLARRGATGHGGAVLSMAMARSGDARRSALAALAQIGSPGEIDGLSSLVASGDADWALGEDALASILRRAEDRDAGVARAIARYEAHDASAALLRLLPRVGGSTALAHVRSALDEMGTRAQAITALGAWADAEAFDALLAVAREARDEREASMDGLIRLAALASEGSASDRAARYAQIATLDATPAQRRTILNGLSRVADPRALALAERMLDDEAMRPATARAAIAIAASLAREHRLRAIAGLDLVRERSPTDEEIRQAANIAQDTIERDLDYVLAWMVAGPYEREGVPASDLISTPFPPEERDASVNWSDLPPNDQAFPGRFDLARAIGGENRCAYVRTYLWTDRVQRVRLEIGSDDGVKVWLNGRAVHENNVMRGLRPREDIVEVNLREGWNTLMLKVSQGGGGWGFACRVRRDDGLGANGLRALPRPDWGSTPPGSILLFDGRDLTKWKHLDGRDAAWEIEQRALVIRAGAGSLITRDALADGLYFVEFSTSRHPWDVTGQARGNSGVYLQGRYEVQVLDSWGDAPAHNRCGGIYGKKPPDFAACARPAEWQNYLIDFTPPTWTDDGTKTAHARMTVWHNGVLIHDNVEVNSATGAGQPEAPGAAPLLLQDHGNPVRYGRTWHLPREVAWEGPSAQGFTTLFDGRTLDGWVRRGGEAQYAIEDGAIVGRTRAHQPNTFLCTERAFDNFVLELEFKIDDDLNSGVQIRSNSTSTYQNGRVHGYQVEIDPSPRSWSAGIYDEARRGWLADLSDRPDARAALKRGEWNRLRVVARGDTIRTFLNGRSIATLNDDMTPSGFIALQVHGVGPREEPLEVRWRDIRVRPLD